MIPYQLHLSYTSAASQAEGTMRPSLLATGINDVANLDPATQKAKLQLLKECAGVMFFAGADSVRLCPTVLASALTFRLCRLPTHCKHWSWPW